MEPIRTTCLLGCALLLALTSCTAQEGAVAPPERAPADTASQAPSTAATRQKAPPPLTTLTVVGDIMLGRGVAGQPGGAPARLRALAPHLRASDLTVGNLESTLSDDGPPQQGTDSFSAAPAVLNALAGAGVDALSLANNHTGDHGDPALLETVAAFRGHRIESFGAGRDLRAATRAAVLTRNGVRFGFLGFNAIGETPRATPRTPGALSVRMPPRTGPLNQADLAHVVDAIRRLRSGSTWSWCSPTGARSTPTLPNRSSRSSGGGSSTPALTGRRRAPALGAGPGEYDDAVIAHSLGNFVFDMDFMEQTMEGVTLTARFRGDRLRGVELTPYRLDDAFTPRRVSGPAARAILRDVHTHDVGSDPGPDQRSQASTRRPLRASWARLTTGGRSAALW